MSLIQAALDKTAQAKVMLLPKPAVPESAPAVPAPKPSSVASAPKPAMKPAVPVSKPVQRVRIWPSPMVDEKIEKELSAVQHRHNAKRWFWWKVGAGVFLLALAIMIPFLKKSFENKIPPVASTTISEPVRALAPAAPVERIASRPRSIAKPSIPVSFSNSNYRLSGITNLGDGPRAIINNRIVAEGDLVAEQTFVKEIGTNEVLLDVKGKEILLKM